MRSEFRFTVLSGGIPIGGCHFLIELDDKRIAIDCGAVQRGGRVLPPPIAKGRIDALLETHGHFDHTGMRPLFVREHPETPIYATKVTHRFTRVSLWDSYWLNQRKLERGEKVEAVFSASEIEDALSFKRCKLVHKPEWFSPWPGWKIRFWPAGHINGAASIHIISPGGFRIIHSGDISFHDQPTIKGAQIINDMFSPEVLITEATYGNRDMPNRQAEEQRLVDRVAGVLGRGGKVLVPAVSLTGPNIGIILANGLARAGVDVPVYIDGGIRKAAEIINSSNEWSPNDDGLVFPKNLIAVPESQGEAYACRQEIIESGRPAVVVSSHGMLEGGMAMFYLPYILPDKKNAVLIPGYQAEGTRGSSLLKVSKGECFRLRNKDVPRNCDVERFHLSSHASGDELAKWIAEIQPWLVIGTHGSYEAYNKGLKKKIRALHSSIQISGGYNGREIVY